MALRRGRRPKTGLSGCVTAPKQGSAAGARPAFAASKTQDSHVGVGAGRQTAPFSAVCLRNIGNQQRAQRIGNGAGFRIAARDLEIRGAGNILGGEQSGQIAAGGFELYT